MAKNNVEFGGIGEQIALEFLEKQGYKILEKNWRSRHAEVDLIASAGKVIVFVEVKTRSTNFFSEPEAAVHSKKQKLLARAASDYLAKNNLDTEVRFDIISIVLKGDDKEITHFEDAFFPYDL